MSVSSSVFGMFLFRRRSELKLSQAALAKLIGVRPIVIYGWEKGKNDAMEAYISALAEALETTEEELRVVTGVTPRYKSIEIPEEPVRAPEVAVTSTPDQRGPSMNTKPAPQARGQVPLGDMRRYATVGIDDFQWLIKITLALRSDKTLPLEVAQFLLQERAEYFLK